MSPQRNPSRLPINIARLFPILLVITLGAMGLAVSRMGEQEAAPSIAISQLTTLYPKLIEDSVVSEYPYVRNMVFTIDERELCGDAEAKMAALLGENWHSIPMAGIDEELLDEGARTLLDLSDCGRIYRHKEFPNSYVLLFRMHLPDAEPMVVVSAVKGAIKTRGS